MKKVTSNVNQKKKKKKKIKSGGLNYNTRNNISFSVSKIYFIYIMASIDFTDDQNAMRRVI